MSNIESSLGFPGKLRTVFACGVAGVIGRDPQPTFNDIFRASYKTAEAPYRSPMAYSNPPLEELEALIYEQALLADRNTSPETLPWTGQRFSQGLHLATMVALSNQHREPIPYEHFVPELSRDFVDRVQYRAQLKARQITLPEQFAEALAITNESVLGAALVAHAGARSIARVSDTRIDPRFNYTPEEVRQWRDCVSSFEAISGEYDDPPAETYHFWGTFIAGLLSETGDRLRDKLFNPLYRYLYTRAAEFTEVLRYRIARKQGVTHKEADVLGYHLGSMVGSALRSR